MAFMQTKKSAFQGAQEKGKVPDGDHLVRVRGMRRSELKSGAGIINIDLEIVRSKVNGLEVTDFAGREFDVRYFLPVDNEEQFDKTFERFVERDMKHLLGKVPEGDFTSDEVFEGWCKAALGRGAWVNRQTSEKVDKNGSPYVNVYFNGGADVPARSSSAASPMSNNYNPVSPSGAKADPNKAATPDHGGPDYAQGGDDDDIPF